MERTVIYTAIFGGYDDLRTQPACPGVDFVCFTDDSGLKSEQWRVQVAEPRFEDPRMAAKWFKLFPHQALPGYRRSIWIDGGIQISTETFAEEVLSFLPRAGIAMFPHPSRTTIKQEADELIRLGRFPDQPFLPQVDHYYSRGFPDNAGLFAATVMARNHRSRKVRRLGGLWMEEILEWSVRDQLSLPYVLWKLKLKPGVIPYDIWDNHLLTMVEHNNRS
ncbi:MAG TPA: glycosyltransferase domain-containing protein [Actinomycetota bacterium]|nr:glycosyltransferase domain-containing protein [Actinomycetota bacterium]